MWRSLEFRNGVEAADPRLLRANKYLPARRQFISLAQRSKPHIVGFWLIINRGRIERRPALGAETLHTDVSAIGDLSIFCRFTGSTNVPGRVIITARNGASLIVRCDLHCAIA